MTDLMETLEDWRHWELDRIERFYGYYKSGNSESPEMFPDPLPEGEFDEQFRLWDE